MKTSWEMKVYVCMFTFVLQLNSTRYVLFLSELAGKKRVKKKLSSLFKLAKPVFYKRRFKPTTL